MLKRNYIKSEKKTSEFGKNAVFQENYKMCKYETEILWMKSLEKY
jgi:hypothetical protein